MKYTRSAHAYAFQQTKSAAERTADKLQEQAHALATIKRHAEKIAEQLAKMNETQDDNPNREAARLMLAAAVQSITQHAAQLLNATIYDISQIKTI